MINALMNILIVEDDHSTAATGFSPPPDDANMKRQTKKA